MKEDNFKVFINEKIGDHNFKSRNFFISAVELAVFKKRGSKIISGFSSMRVFWNNSDTSYRNFYSKKI